MANILFLSDNELFRDDLHDQLQLYAPEFNVFDSYSDDTVYDVVMIDDKNDTMLTLQNKLRQTPIIFLGNNTADIADSVIVINKPFCLNSLLDTVLSCVNRFTRSNEGLLPFGSYCLDSGKKEITNLKSKIITKLTEREVMILNYLYKAHPKIVSKNELLSEVWGYNPDATTHTVETHIYRLRQKIEGHENSPVITTEDSGYLLNF